MYQLLLHIIGYDIWFYISHRMLHTRVLWWAHKIHHEKRHPLFIDTYYGHWAEGPFQSVGFLLPIALGFWNFWLALLALIIVNARGIARHDGRTVWLIGNHHLIHHETGTVNFGDYWVDRLFRTAAPPERQVRGFLYL